MENSLGKKILFYRRAKGMTQEDLAEKLNVSPQAVSKWENENSCPDILLIAPLANLLGVTTDELLSAESIKEVRLIPNNQSKSLDELILKVIVNSACGDKVRVNLPLPIIKLGIELGVVLPQVSGNEQLRNIDFLKIVALAERGVLGKLVEVNSANGDTVEILVE